MSFFLPFETVTDADLREIGGKAFTLACLLQAGFPVPPGAALTRVPGREEEWEAVFAWWDRAGSPPLAVRSSGVDEDSEEHSFAGQHRTFLDVRDRGALRQAVEDCFASPLAANATAYRQRLASGEAPGSAPGMGVALQKLIRPQFAGVYFTRDPRGGQGALAEVVRGFGESLVSGHVTPVQLLPEAELSAAARELGWTSEHSRVLFESAPRVAETLGYDADIEWAVDEQGQLWILQARPITTLRREEGRTQAEAREFRRLAAANTSDTIWDGQTFSEWTGAPTPLSFGLWQRAFTRAGALGSALHELGYAGSESRELFPHESVLESVFAKPYVNLSRMERLYFGATPYVMVPRPRPHLEFRWRKLTLGALLNCIPGTWRMMSVAWRLGTGRRDILKRAETALAEFQRAHRLPNDPLIYRDWEAPALRERFDTLSRLFTHEALVEPLKLMIAIESAQQGLLREIGEARLGEWIATRLRLPSLEMATEFARAAAQPSRRAAFLARFGHRGPGELDLAQPRWSELGERAFVGGDAASPTAAPRAAREEERAPAEAIGVREKMAEADWAILSRMLELREHWKDALLSVYAHLRWVAVELGRQSGLGEQIFWLKPSELPRAWGPSAIDRARLQELVARRRQRHEWLQPVSLPLVFSLVDLQAGPAAAQETEQGEGLSGGLAYGEVRLVSDPTRIDWKRWPENAVLVAENTDPGWTPLFVKARAVVTERGGALSHCAIVAREMGLPAVSGIRSCMSKFKEGEHVWVDGTRGVVIRA